MATPQLTEGGGRPAVRAGLAAAVLLVVVAMLGVRATGSLKVTAFVGPVLIATGVGVVLGAFERSTTARRFYAIAAALSIVFGVITIFSVGIMFLAVGVLLIWAMSKSDANHIRG